MAAGSKEEEHSRAQLEEASRTGFRVFLQEYAEDMPQVSKMFPKATASSTDWFPSGREVEVLPRGTVKMPWAVTAHGVTGLEVAVQSCRVSPCRPTGWGRR